LEEFGDLGSLLIVRDSLFFDKKTYGEFLSSREQISTNILASRLSQLPEKGILRRTVDGDLAVAFRLGRRPSASEWRLVLSDDSCFVIA